QRTAPPEASATGGTPHDGAGNHRTRPAPDARGAELAVARTAPPEAAATGGTPHDGDGNHRTRAVRAAGRAGAGDGRGAGLTVIRPAPRGRAALPPGGRTALLDYASGG
ncbi:hypothetical protein ACFTZM_32915, partial [Streptomyces hydrogenans]